VTDNNGNFSFPLVRPGNWNFHIYANSLPSGYIIENSVYNFELRPGDNLQLPFEMKKKQRNIIFKSQGVSLSTSGDPAPAPTKLSTSPVKEAEAETTQLEADSQFYTIQIGAFRKKLKSNSRFLNGEQFDFEKEIDNLNKYFIGKFSTLEEAKKEKKRLEQKFKGAFIVLFKNGEFVKNINE
jgi:hypothetical protein